MLAALLVWGYAENWSEILRLHGVDIGYVMMADAAELQKYYPSYYWAIYTASRIIRFGIPLSILGAIAFVPRLRKFASRTLAKVWTKDTGVVKGIIVPLFATFGISMAAYYGLTPMSSGPFKYQLILAQSWLFLNLLNALLSVLFSREEVLFRCRKFLFEPQLPYALAIFRILFFTYVAYLYVFHLNGSHLGALEKVHLPFIGWLIDTLPVTPTIYGWVTGIGTVAALFVAVGYRTRLFLIINAPTIFYAVASLNFFGKLAHQHMVIWISWIMAFSPCFDVLAIDARKNAASSVLKRPVYSFHLRVIWLHFGLVYLFAGFYKFWICGFDWALTNSMINQVQIEWFEHFDKVSSWRLDKFPKLLMVGGVAVIFFELAYPFLLFHRKLRWVSIFGGLIMHNVLGKVMYIAFLTLLQVFYVVFIPWNFLLEKFGFIKNKFDTDLTLPKLKTWGIIGPLFILGMNTLFGIFNINSYPFSVYPVYAEIVPDNVKYFEYRPLDKGLEELNARVEGKDFGFKWERYSRTEYHMIRMWEGGNGIDSVGVRTMWKRWQLDVPTLAQVDSVDIFVVERPLDPAKKDLRVSEKYLMTILSE